uniref:Uncharacterized protein n=1 Tax=Cannabis sativa TaxID=3483 RepID=A0A803QI64_CANSA
MENTQHNELVVEEETVHLPRKEPYGSQPQNRPNQGKGPTKRNSERDSQLLEYPPDHGEECWYVLASALRLSIITQPKVDL